MRDRYYSSELHRFLSLDKDQGDLYKPSTLNPYAYVGNDPINFIDPSGMTAVNLVNAIKNTIINEDGSINWGGLADIGLNVVGLIPGVGDLAKASRLGKNAIKTVDAIADVTDGLNDARKAIKRTDALVDASKAAKNVGNGAEAIDTANDASKALKHAEKIENRLSVVYDPDFAAKQILNSHTNITPGIRIITAHAAKRMINPPKGRIPTQVSQVDDFLDKAAGVRKRTYHPLGDTLTIVNSNSDIKEIVVDEATGKKVITVINKKR